MAVEKVMLRFPCRFCGADKGRWCVVRSSKTAKAAKHLHGTRFRDAHAAGALPLTGPRGAA